MGDSCQAWVPPHEMIAARPRRFRTKAGRQNQQRKKCFPLLPCQQLVRSRRLTTDRVEIADSMSASQRKLPAEARNQVAADAPQGTLRPGQLFASASGDVLAGAFFLTALLGLAGTAFGSAMDGLSFDLVAGVLSSPSSDMLAGTTINAASFSFNSCKASSDRNCFPLLVREQRRYRTPATFSKSTRPKVASCAPALKNRKLSRSDICRSFCTPVAK